MPLACSFRGQSGLLLLLCSSLVFLTTSFAGSRPVLGMSLRGTPPPRPCVTRADFKSELLPASALLRSCFSARPLGTIRAQTVFVGAGVPDHEVALGEVEKICELNWRVVADSKPIWTRSVTELGQDSPLGIALNGVLLFPPKIQKSTNQDIGYSSPHIHETFACNGDADNAEGTWQYRHPAFGCKQATSADLIGFALDGFGIYGPYIDKSMAEVDSILDSCNGRWDETDGTYKYHTRTLSQAGYTSISNASPSSYHRGVSHRFVQSRRPYIIGCFHGTKVASIELDSKHETCRNTSIREAKRANEAVFGGRQKDDGLSVPTLRQNRPNTLAKRTRGLPHPSSGLQTALLAGSTSLPVKEDVRKADFSRGGEEPFLNESDDEFWGGFPGDAHTVTGTGEVVRLDALSVGDTVRGSRGVLSALYFFSAASPITTKFISYLAITTAEGPTVTVHPSQYMPINGHLTVARNAAVGDLLTLANGRQSPVTSVKPTRRLSRYAPHLVPLLGSRGGDARLAIDGVEVSGYYARAAPRSLSLRVARAAHYTCGRSRICLRVLDSNPARAVWAGLARLSVTGSDYWSTSTATN